MTLTVHPQRLSIARLPATENIPSWAAQSPFFSVTRTSDELSIVASQEIIPASIRQEKGWRALRIQGPIALTEVGLLNSLTKPLGDAGISIFAISTFDTDYVLVKEENLSRAIDVLSAAGHDIAINLR